MKSQLARSRGGHWAYLILALISSAPVRVPPRVALKPLPHPFDIPQHAPAQAFGSVRNHAPPLSAQVPRATASLSVDAADQPGSIGPQWRSNHDPSDGRLNPGAGI